VSKKLQQKQERRRAEEARKAAQRRAHQRTNLMTIGIAVVVGALVVGGIIYQRSTGEGGGAPDKVGVSEAAANCDGVQEHKELKADHIDPGAPHEPYNSSPPTSGPHLEAAATPGFYEDALPPEQPVHNLEHGQIVIWYSAEAPASVIDDIEVLVDQEPAATVATPYGDMPDDANLVLTAWGNSQACEQVSQTVVNEFRSSFQGRVGPEGELTRPFEG
jgi:hypothetical protein